MYRLRGLGDSTYQDSLIVSGPVNIDTGAPSSTDLSSMAAELLSSTQATVGPDASAVAPLQVGTLAQQVSSSGQYSVNPSTGQLQTNLVAGVSNASLLWIAGAAIGGVMLLGAFGGGRGRRR